MSHGLTPAGERFRVDALPGPLRPIVWVYGWVLALAAYAYCLATRATLRVTVRREGVPPAGNCIYCLWHEAIILLFHTQVPRLRAGLERHPHAWLQHPVWFMKPVHIFLRLIGVERLALGSTGHGGRVGADELVALLGRGHSTVFLPDGPRGPPRALKRGVLHVAAQSGVAIVPLRLAASAALRLPTWDRKWLPLPFSRVDLRLGPPIEVREDALAEAERRLIEALG